EEHEAGQVHGPARLQAEQAERLHVVADEDGDRGGREDVLDQDGRAGEEAAPGAERTAREAVAAARGGQDRGQFGQGEDHAGVHGAHQHHGDRQAAEAALGQAEVPARVVAGDDVGDAEARQQQPAGAAAAQPAAVQVVVRFGGGGGTGGGRKAHGGLP